MAPTSPFPVFKHLEPFLVKFETLKLINRILVKYQTLKYFFFIVRTQYAVRMRRHLCQHLSEFVYLFVLAGAKGNMDFEFSSNVVSSKQR